MTTPDRPTDTPAASSSQWEADCLAAEAYRDSLLPRADGMLRGVYPYWHGWAIHDAYLAGLKAGRKEVKRGK